jgi:hypothetical protein
VPHEKVTAFWEIKNMPPRTSMHSNNPLNTKTFPLNYVFHLGITRHKDRATSSSLSVGYFNTPTSIAFLWIYVVDLVVRRKQ